MAKNLKELVALSKGELVAMGSDIGLTFHEGMRKVDMAQQLAMSAASGWMEVNKELITGHEETYDDSGSAMMFEGHTTLSDAAQMAQIISGAGYTEAFHAAMNGPSNHLEAVGSYLEQLGVKADDVWMHMPKANPELPAKHWGSLNNYLRDTLSGHQDIMPELPGHYSGNIMDEYSTNRGGVQQSYDYLAHMYVDREQYSSRESYQHDIGLVTTRLQSQMGERFKEVAFATGQSIHNSHSEGKVASYIEALPMLGNPDVVKGVQHPRQPLNASALPLGSFGPGINTEYSLTASLTNQPGWADASKALYRDLSESTKSLAKVYSGGSDKGLSVGSVTTSDREQILDSASRYADIFDVRHGYENLKRDVGDEPRYSGAAIRAVLENANEYNEAEASASFDPAERVRNVLRGDIPPPAQAGRDFTASFGQPTFSNPAFERREAKRIADLDAASSDYRAPDASNSGASDSSGPQYHFDIQQGTQEWLDLRSQYDITGSTVGSMLGNNSGTRPWAEMVDRLGLQRGKGSKNNNFTQRMFAKGHETEDRAREALSKELGINIQQVGAITNESFPGMIYSPDGLIGDDALWEHKNPENAKAGFADLLAGDHPDYMDQIQMGMAMTGRSRTLFSQTRKGERRDQWIDADPEWYERNKTRLDSIRGRLAAGREFLEQNPGEDNDRERIMGARKVMMGEGIWKDISQKSNRGYSATAGTSSDPFVRSSNDADFAPSQSSAPTPPPASGDSETSSMAEAVKQGILGAQEENKKRGESAGSLVDPNGPKFQQTKATPEDANAAFDTMMRSTMYGKGYAGGGGNGGGRNPPPDWMTGGSGDIIRGIAGGSIGSASGGVLSAMSRTPWGMAAATAIGAVSIGNEAAENINEFVGTAEDAGMMNPNEYSSMGMGLQQLGLNEQQANRINQTTHSAFNTLLNGDPSAAIRMVQGTRGLITIGDIRAAEGDPVALARVIRERGAERGWSQQRIAGAMEMAGLQGMARAANRGDYAQGMAEGRVQRGRDSDYAEGIAANETLQANRGDLNVSQNVLQGSISYGAPLLNGARDAIIDARAGASTVSGLASNAYDFVMGEESGGRDYDANGNVLTSSTGAKGRMQVLNSTNKDPGFGVRPAADDSLEERARVGRDYLDAMQKRYGDTRKAMAAYTDGPGTVDQAVKDYGTDWLNHMPAQARNRVAKYDDWIAKGGMTQEGAGGFTRNGVSYGQTAPVINVNINAKVNNQTATATVAAGNQTTTQTLNMGNGANQRR